LDLYESLKMVGLDEDKGMERVNVAVSELKRVTKVLSEGLERLSNGMNRRFDTTDFV